MIEYDVLRLQEPHKGSLQMAFSRRKFIQTGVGSAVAVAASAAGAAVLRNEALPVAGGNMGSDMGGRATPAEPNEPQAANLPPSPQAAGAQGAAHANTYQSPVTWAGAPNVVMAPDRMPEIPADKMTDAQKKAVEEFAAGRATPVFGPFVPLLR